MVIAIVTSKVNVIPRSKGRLREMKVSPMSMVISMSKSYFNSTKVKVNGHFKAEGSFHGKRVTSDQ